MFFRRRRKVDPDDVEDVEQSDDLDEDAAANSEDAPDVDGEDDPDGDRDADDDGDADDGDADGTAGGATESVGDDQPEGQTDWEALDAQEWRQDGPYDITEFDPVDDPEGRLDLGGIIVRGFDGMELRLQVAEETQEIVSVMMLHGGSALEVAAFAAPRSGGLWQELRDEIVDAAADAGGSVGLVEGPFGTEVRRLLPVRTKEDKDGYQLTRMWAAQGPRWLLRGLVYGDAALAEDLDDPAVVELLDAFRAIVVRRGDTAMAPGDLVPLTFPTPLGAVEGEEDTADGDVEGPG